MKAYLDPLMARMKESAVFDTSILAGWCVSHVVTKFDLSSIIIALNLPSLAQIEDGSARSLIATFDVKKRVYFGNTSMESEISLVMANQALVCFE
jgi:hypothetical protein